MVDVMCDGQGDELGEGNEERVREKYKLKRREQKADTNAVGPQKRRSDADNTKEEEDEQHGVEGEMAGGMQPPNALLHLLHLPVVLFLHSVPTHYFKLFLPRHPLLKSNGVADLQRKRGEEREMREVRVKERDISPKECVHPRSISRPCENFLLEENIHNNMRK